MKLGRVVGNVWATRKDARLSSLTLLLVQCLDIITKEPDGAPIVAEDNIGAGFGELVIVVSGSSARSAAGDMNIPVDAAVVAIVDNFDLASGEKKGTK